MMNVSDWIDEQKLTVCIGPKGLPAWLAIDPTRSLEDELGIRFDWLPITTGLESLSASVPGAPAENDPLAEYKARRRRAREKWARREFERSCERLALTEAEATRDYDVATAAMALLWVRKSGLDCGAFIREVFEGACCGNLNPEDPGTIEELLMVCEIPHRGFAEYCEADGPRELQELQGVFEELQVFSSPAYLYKGERFHGREHLPLIRWYLTGRVGSPPV
ncbi:MAG: hypothetical protein HUJ31_08705 [Pseudomonadales bacterium]|nr:hypothetical protein [Pseudomonadales bacterium]